MSAAETQSRMDRLIGKGYKIVAFKDLPETHQLSVVQYLAMDCFSWEDFSDGDGPSLARYSQEYGDELFGVIELSSSAVMDAVMAGPEIGSSHPSWSAYAAWYCAGGDVPVYGASSKWPVILSEDDEEIILDGWHRFHSYMRSGFDSVPAVFFPSERHSKAA